MTDTKRMVVVILIESDGSDGANLANHQGWQVHEKGTTDNDTKVDQEKLIPNEHHWNFFDEVAFLI